LKKIHEVTCIWYTNVNNDEVKEFEEKFTECPFEHCKNRTELFDALEQSIRVVLIVSDSDGFQMVNNLGTNLNKNKTIISIVCKLNGTSADPPAAKGHVSHSQEADLDNFAEEMKGKAASALAEQGLDKKMEDYAAEMNKKNGYEPKKSLKPVKEMNKK